MRDNAIIQPVNRKGLFLAEPVLLVSAETDVRILINLFKLESIEETSLMMSTVYDGLSQGQPVSIIGPMIGAPYATLVLEEAIAAGAKKFLFVGRCGSLSEQVGIGDCIVPDASYIDEGTSRCYPMDSEIAYPDLDFTNTIFKAMKQSDQNSHCGKIWCTDGLYQETPKKVKYYQDKDAIGVEMETSALFTVAGYRKVSIAAMLVVSDHLYSFSWHSGFGTKAYKSGLSKLLTSVKDIITSD